MTCTVLLPERIVFATARVTVGEWRCARTHPLFTDSGPIERHLVAFARTSVGIRHEGARAFTADASVATIYNRGQCYTREAIHPRGDLCDWWAVDADTAAQIAESVDGRVHGDHRRTLRYTRAPVEASLYLRQRTWLMRLRGGGVEPLAAEEAVMGLVHDTVAAAAIAQGAHEPKASPQAREVAEAAARELARSCEQRHTLDQLAARLGVSPFHLCRSFRATHGRTLHRHLTQLRLRASLEALTETKQDLTQLALDHGFSSHSHYSAAFRLEFGLSPSEWRARRRAIS